MAHYKTCILMPMYLDLDKMDDKVDAIMELFDLNKDTPGYDGNPLGKLDGWTLQEYADGEELIKENFIAHAVITPEGEWIEAPKFWYDVSGDDPEFKAWKTKFQNILAKYKDDCFVAIVDCHM